MLHLKNFKKTLLLTSADVNTCSGLVSQLVHAALLKRAWKRGTYQNIIKHLGRD